MPYPDCCPLLSFAAKYHRCCKFQIINIQGIKKDQHMSTISRYFSQFIASHFIKGLNVGKVGITLKFWTNVGILLKCRKCRTTGRPEHITYQINNHISIVDYTRVICRPHLSNGLC